MKYPFIVTSLLAASMFFTGASGLVNEYVLSTVSTYLLGSSIEQFSITIALMLGMMGLGSHMQKYLSDHRLIDTFISIEIALALLGSFAPIAIYAAFGYVNEHFNLIYYFFACAIGFFIGFEIPMIIRINEYYTSTLKVNLSSVMAADYIGSLVGALVWVYLLLPTFNLNQISFIVSGVNFVVAFVTFCFFLWAGVMRFRIGHLLLLSGVAVTIFMGYHKVLDWESLLEQRLYNDPIIASETTRYQHLTLTKNHRLNELRLYINGNVQFSSLDERRYHELMVHSVMELHGTPANILVLGGGDGLAVRELKKYSNVNSITLVDLDKGIIRFASEHPEITALNQNAFADARVHVLPFNATSDQITDVTKLDDQNASMTIASVHVINIDADLFLAKLLNQYFDVVIIDFPDPSSIELNKLYTKEFFLKLKHHLNGTSKIIMQSTSPYHAKESFLCIGRTLTAAGYNVVPMHLNIPSFGDWGWWIGSINATENIKNSIRQIHHFEVNTTFLTPDILHASLIFGKQSLHSNSNAINTLMQPSLLAIYKNNSWLNY